MPTCLPGWMGRQVFTRRFYELSFLKAVLIVSSFNNTGTKIAKLYIKNSSRKRRREFRPCVCLDRVNIAEWATRVGPSSASFPLLDGPDVSPVQLCQGPGFPCGASLLGWRNPAERTQRPIRDGAAVNPQPPNAPSCPPGCSPPPAGSPARKPACGPCWPQTPSTWASLSAGRRSRHCSRTCGDRAVSIQRRPKMLAVSPVPTLRPAVLTAPGLAQDRDVSDPVPGAEPLSGVLICRCANSQSTRKLYRHRGPALCL